VRPLLALARRTRGPGLGLAAVLAALTYLCAVALLGCSAWLLSRAAEHPDASSLALAAVAVRALGLGRGLSRYAERLVGHRAVLTAVADLRVAVFEGLLRQPPGAPRTGDALAHVVGDVEVVQDLWLRCLLPWLSGLLASAACVAALAWWDPAAALVLLAGLGLALTVVPALGARLARREDAVAGVRAAHLEQVLDVVQGCADLTAYGELPRALGAATTSGRALADLDRRAAASASAVAALSTLLQGVTVLGVALAGLQAVQAGTLPRVGLAVVVLVALGSFEAVSGLAEAGALLPRTAGAAARLLPLLDLPAPLSATGALSPELPRLVGAGVRYPGATRAALSGVDLQLRPGRSLAVVGGSGAGKSTLLALLSGQLSPSEGSATIGGQVAAAVPEDLRAARVVLAEQDAHLFEASVLDNLRVARPDATQEQVRSALETAGLADWVASLPQGLQTPVGERGSRISGGERRRLSVARALLSPAPVLLLDEPTEGLDPAAADALVRRLVAGARGRTVVLVTHRTAALDCVDDVLVLEAGRVAADQGSLAGTGVTAG
jgi:ATP-binding cassette subfamily C protein CydCD